MIIRNEILRHPGRHNLGRANMSRKGSEAGVINCSGLPRFIPPAPTQPCKAGAAQSRRNHTEGNEHEDSIRRGTIMSKTVAKGGDRERSDCYDLFDWVKDRCRQGRPALPHKWQKPMPALDGRGVGNARRQEYTKSGKRRCVKCGRNEIYRDIKTMDWCEPCIWEFVKND